MRWKDGVFSVKIAGHMADDNKLTINFIAGFHDMNYVHRSHKGGNETSKKK